MPELGKRILTDDTSGNLSEWKSQNRAAWVTQFEPIVIDPQGITGGDAVLWDPGTANTSIYSVEFFINNQTAVDGVTTIGIDVGAGGGLGATEYIVFQYPVPGNSHTPWFGPFYIDGDDTIRGLATSSCNIHFRVKRLVQP